MPTPTTAFCIFCDDIRQEVGNKLSILGIYEGDIVFSVPPPAALPKFGIIVWLQTDIDNPPEKFSIRGLVPPNQKVAFSATVRKVEFNKNPADDAKRLNLKTIIPIINMEFTEEGPLEVFVDTEEGTFRAGRLFIRFASPAEGQTSAEIMAGDLSG